MVDLARWIDLTRLRATHSRTGNDFTPYQIKRKLITQDSDDAITLDDQLLDHDLKPESTRSQEIGLDFQLFNERLQIWTTYYHSTTNDYPLLILLPFSAGANTAYKMPVKLRIKGLNC